MLSSKKKRAELNIKVLYLDSSLLFWVQMKHNRWEVDKLIICKELTFEKLRRNLAVG